MGGLTYDIFLKEESDSINKDKTVIELIEKYNVRSYAQLVKYCLYVQPKYYQSVVGRCGFWSAYVKSRANDFISVEMEYVIEESRGKKECQ